MLRKRYKVKTEKYENIFENVPFEDIYKIKKYIQENYISKEIIVEKINERKFELQQEYKNFETDEILKRYKELVEEK